MEAELTLFLRTRTKEFAGAKIYSDKRVFFTCYRTYWSPKRRARSDFWPEARTQVYLCMRREKIGPNLAYCVVKSSKFQPLYGQSQSLNTTSFKPVKNLVT